MLVLLAAAYFFFMETVEVHSDVRVDLLVGLVVMFNAVAPSFALEGLHVVAVLVGEATWAAVRSWRG